MLASFSRVECRGDESTPGPPLCTGGYPQVFPGRIFEDSPLGYGALFVFVHSRREEIEGKEMTGIHRRSKTMDWTTHLRGVDGGGSMERLCGQPPSVEEGIYLVGAKRTPYGAFGGKLKDISSIDLAAAALAGVMKQAKVAPEMVDSVTVGNVCQSTSPNGPYLARHAALRAKVPINVPCLTVNRLCGSGFQAVVTAAQEIALGAADICLAAGAENMSQAPYIIRDARFGLRLGVEPKAMIIMMEDSLMSAVTDHNINTPMGITAENLAVKYKLSREDCDRYALQSQQRWKEAYDGGRMKEEMEPLKVKVKGKEELMEMDEHPRPGTTMEALAKLKPAFKKDGVVTPGNASGISDGSAAVAVASEAAVKKHNLKPLARLAGYSYVGCEPSIMGIGPVNAIQLLLSRTGLKLSDIDLVDVNEAFASQFLAVQMELGLDPAKTNVNGGAIALGHPVGSSGARITANLIYELK
ncbi:ACAA2 [Cordylochernes scorpioides]|uniref:ACAA2 n=1 Tax=Cordylochernes scorpioides TaxID=51811 RepID=A0ABY6LUR1_9ARAC|nr:ACAA2 [Cordylochernes scorpioides]